MQKRDENKDKLKTIYSKEKTETLWTYGQIEQKEQEWNK